MIRTLIKVPEILTFALIIAVTIALVKTVDCSSPAERQRAAEGWK